MKKYFLFIFILIPLTANFATVVVQENGDVVSGSVKEDRGNSILFQSKYGNLVIEKRKIKKLIQDESTIKPETIEYRGNQIEVRFLFEDVDQKVYITAKGQIIRILFKEIHQKQKVKQIPGEKFKNSRLGVFGSIGILNQPYPYSTNSDIQWVYDMSTLVPGFEISYVYYLLPALGIGLEFTKYFHNLEYQYKVSENEVTDKITNDFYGLNFIAEFSLVGALGQTGNIHDVGVGANAGISLVQSGLTIESDLSSKVTASGSNLHFNGGVYLYYSLKLNSFLGLFAKAQYRFFAYQTLYQPGEFNAEDQKLTTNSVLARLDDLAKNSFDMPQGWSFALGIRVGF